MALKEKEAEGYDLPIKRGYGRQFLYTASDEGSVMKRCWALGYQISTVEKLHIISNADKHMPAVPLEHLISCLK